MTAPDSVREPGSMPAWRKYALVPAALAVVCLCAAALGQMPQRGQPSVLLQVSSPPSREAMTTMLVGDGEGMTYMPTNTAGISDHDASPTMDTKFYQEEDRSARRMKKLKLLLTKSAKMQDALDVKVKGLHELVESEVTTVKDKVLQLNQKDTDEINQPYHVIQGPPGPRGMVGLNGLDGAAGENGLMGGQGPRGSAGASGIAGRSGPEGVSGVMGNLGPLGRKGEPGGEGGQGLMGSDGNLAGTDSWSSQRYFCPGGGNEHTRLTDCTTNDCRLEVNYDGEWGTVCDAQFSAKSAFVVCNSLGFIEGGVRRTARSKGLGPIWMKNVQCAGKESDIGDCPKTCGGHGCSHQNDVGICCWGLPTGAVLKRKNLRDGFHTVKELRDMCYKPKACDLPGAMEKKIEFHSTCDYGGNNQDLILGNYERLWSDGTCDEDTEVCAIKGCKALPSSISSFKVPDGLSLTMFSGNYFSGNSITYEGPADVPCLSWEGWNNRARSLKILTIKDMPRKATQWTMQMFSATGNLVNMPARLALDRVGDGVSVPWINMHGVAEFRRYQPLTPNKNFMAVFFGMPEVRESGQYKICVTSVDGVQVYLNNDMIINDDGRHPQRQKCKTQGLTRGKVKMEVRYFHHSDAPNLMLTWKGPGTDNNQMIIRCEDKMAMSQLPADTPKSEFSVRVFQSPRSLFSIPDLDMCTLVGSAAGLPRAAFDSVFDLRKYVKATPNVGFLWDLYGSVRIRQGGTYNFCTCSADGSRIILDNLALVDNNDGTHSTQCQCASRVLAAGEYPITVEGYDGVTSTGANEKVLYSGPDTGGAQLELKSVGKERGTMPPIPEAKSSEMTLRIFSPDAQSLNSWVPFTGSLNFVGQGKVEFPYFENIGDYKAGVKNVPLSNFVYQLLFDIDISSPGPYQFFTYSKNGALLYVDETLVADNDGNHNLRWRTGSMTLNTGQHKVLIQGEMYDDPHAEFFYKGPDTAEVKRILRGIPGIEPPPRSEFKSQWRMHMYKASWQLNSMADMDRRRMSLIGGKLTKRVEVLGHDKFESEFPGLVPGADYAYSFHGKVRIFRSGTYTFCTTSVDGSMMWVDGSRTVNNDGNHGNRDSCGNKVMNGGLHDVFVAGYASTTRGSIKAYYRGPDTRGHNLQMVSELPGKSVDNKFILPPSEWRLTMRAAPYYLGNFFDMGPMERFAQKGSQKVSEVDIPSIGWLMQQFPGLPHDNVAWDFGGTVEVQKPGDYTFCLTSDDGTRVYINDQIVIENAGYRRNHCKHVQLKTGKFTSRVIGFQGGGGGDLHLTYSGPDTQDPEMPGISFSRPLPSLKAGAVPPALPVSTWRVSAYNSPWGLSSMESVLYRKCKLVGSKTTDSVFAQGGTALRSLFSGLAASNYVWDYAGTIKIDTAGSYTFCSWSDDGTFIYVDGSKLVDDDGLHGVRQACAAKTLTSGDHVVKIVGFQAGGGMYNNQMYYGPDTANHMMDMLSIEAGPEAKAPGESKWRLTMYSAGWELKNLAQALPLTSHMSLIGTKVVSDIYAPNAKFGAYFPGSPTVNIIWIYDGTITVVLPGSYTFCTASDDGSWLYVDNVVVVNNGGLHGRQRRCGLATLKAGDHKIRAPGFQARGGGWMEATYGGPDTGGSLDLIPSVEEGPVLPPPPPSEWRVAIYKAHWHLGQMVDVSLERMDLVAQGLTPKIYAPDGWFQTKFPGCNRDNTAWIYDGNIEIVNGGTYTFCTTSDDGSFLWVDGTKVVDNDGSHGKVHRCGSIGLTAGMKHIKTQGFNGGGGYYMDATYYGADTGNIEMQMISQQAGDKMEDLKAAFALAFPDMSMAPPVNSPWPNLYCYPPSMECLRLGVKDNLCGHCSDLGGGNFRLTNAQAGLRWGGNTFDDNNLHTGSQQVKNICTLAKFGNGGTISIRANGRCRAKSLGWGHDEVHWFANCQEGSASDAACCTNSMELQNGFNWAGFSTGNRCGGDSDADYATEWADCYFG